MRTALAVLLGCLLAGFVIGYSIYPTVDLFPERPASVVWVPVPDPGEGLLVLQDNGSAIFILHDSPKQAPPFDDVESGATSTAYAWIEALNQANAAGLPRLIA